MSLATYGNLGRTGLSAVGSSSEQAILDSGESGALVPHESDQLPAVKIVLCGTWAFEAMHDPSQAVGKRPNRMYQDELKVFG